MKQVAPKFDLQVKDSTIKISVAVSEDELKQTIAAQRGALASMTVPAGGPPVIVGSEPTTGAAPQSQGGGTSVFVLPGKK